MRIQHIPNLPDASKAHELLKQIHSEFSTIASKRGWNIFSLTEMCCCGDGCDHLNGSTTKTPSLSQTKFHKRRRKSRIMSNNVWGYNLSTSRNRFAIHLRLRMPQSHDFISYDSLARTMAHEMAHCVHGKHSADFYDLMEDIIRQHKIFLKKGVVLDSSGFPVGSNQVYTMGGSIDSFTSGSSYSNTRKNINPDKERKKRSRLLSGNKLGHGEGVTALAGNNTGSKTSLKEAMLKAAEKRRIEDSKWCLPCNTGETIIEIFDMDDNILSEDVNENQKVQQKNTSKTTSQSWLNNTIDLTLDDTENTPTICSNLSSNEVDSNKSSSTYSKNLPATISWTCATCTYKNTSMPQFQHASPSLIPTCEMCSTPQLKKKEEASIGSSCLSLHQQIQQKCLEEEMRSKDQFEGFNIYGKSRFTTTHKMK